MGVLWPAEYPQSTMKNTILILGLLVVLLSPAVSCTTASHGQEDSTRSKGATRQYSTAQPAVVDHVAP